ncbi:MAG TPA: metallophosphoesterase [Thermoanaerobaculia bacterium]|nr:metallophosphoesterase [Thermoanaerobaculia bacterium]
MTRKLRSVPRTTLPALALGVLAALATGCATAPPPAAHPESVPRPEPLAPAPLRTWVELGSEGPMVRAIVTDPQAGCPGIEVEHPSVSRHYDMQVRAERQQGFEVLVCEEQLPLDAKSARIGGIRLPLPPKELKRIALIGDTGCRIKCDPDGKCDVQNCNDPKKWPFARVAAQVAAEHPDVVIHVGDYHYREAPCPAGEQKKCGGSPYGDNWPAWQADFFDPAAPLLAAAPWVAVRGNHEDCNRAGNGWFRFLDLKPLPATCNEDPEPFGVSLPGLHLLVLNTSAADDEPAGFYTQAYQVLNGLAAASDDPSWLLSHHPLWGFVESKGSLIPVTDELQQDSKNDLDAKVRLVLAGHIHLFEALAFAPAPQRAPSVVAGMSGTELDKPITKNLVGQSIAGTKVATASTTDEFAYSLLEPQGKGWKMTVHDVKGRKVLDCEIEGEALTCKK